MAGDTRYRRKRDRAKNVHVDKSNTRQNDAPAGPKKFRRLRVVAEEDSEGNFERHRDVVLESTINPLNGTWRMELCNFSLPVDDVVDLIRWADRQQLPVVYDPAGNMAGYFRRKNPQQPSLFDEA